MFVTKIMSRTQAALLAAVAMTAAGATAAHADSVTALLNNVSPSQIVGVNYNGNSLGQAYAGSLNWTGQAGNAAGLTGTFSTFCIDLTQDVNLGHTYTYSLANLADAPNPTPPTAPLNVTGMGALGATHVTNLYALQYDTLGADNDRAAAFQIAIWELLFETGAQGNVSAGNFFVSGASANVTTLANSFVTTAISSGPLFFHNDLIALTSPTAQDQIALGQFHAPPPPEAVPAPAAAFGAIPLLAGLAFFRRAKRRNATAL